MSALLIQANETPPSNYNFSTPKKSCPRDAFLGAPGSSRCNAEAGILSLANCGPSHWDAVAEPAERSAKVLLQNNSV